MNASRVATVNTPAVLALIVAALFGSPTGSAPAVPDSEGVSQVAGR